MRYNTFKTYDQTATRVRADREITVGEAGSMEFERTHEDVPIRGVHASGRTGMVRFWSPVRFPESRTWWVNIRTADGDIIFEADDEEGSTFLDEGKLFSTFSVTPKMNPHGVIEEYEYITRASSELLPSEDDDEFEDEDEFRFDDDDEEE